MQRDDTEHLSDTAVKKKKRFLIVKLEDRIVPSHLPAVAQVVVGSPAVDHAPTHAHKVDFAARAGSSTHVGTRGS